MDEELGHPVRAPERTPAQERSDQELIDMLEAGVDEEDRGRLRPSRNRSARSSGSSEAANHPMDGNESWMAGDDVERVD